MAICTCCEEDKDVSEFSPRADGNKSHMSMCKVCRRERSNPKNIKPCGGCGEPMEDGRSWRCRGCKSLYDRKRKVEKREDYHNYLSDMGCSCCLDKHPHALEVHHLCKGSKRFKGSRSQSSDYNIKDIESGIAIILCATCHLMFHQHFGGRASNFPDQTKESTIMIIKKSRRVAL